MTWAPTSLGYGGLIGDLLSLQWCYLSFYPSFQNVGNTFQPVTLPNPVNNHQLVTLGSASITLASRDTGSKIDTGLNQVNQVNQAL